MTSTNKGNLVRVSGDLDLSDHEIKACTVPELSKRLASVHGDFRNCYGNLTGACCIHAGISGDVSLMWGDLSEASGDMTGKRGFVRECLDRSSACHLTCEKALQRYKEYLHGETSGF